MLFQPKTVQRNLKIIHINGSCLYAATHRYILVSKDLGKTWSRFIDLRSNEKSAVIWRFSLLRRLFRKGVHSLVLTCNDTVVFIADKSILHCLPGQIEATKIADIQRGSRPLFLCLTAAGNILWGEYFGNKERKEVNIYRSKDGGKSFNIVYTFPADSIRHVHGVFYDRFNDKIFVTTGDMDSESGIWVTDDEFNSLEKFVSGSQQVRAVQLLFTEKYVYFGSDSPIERNHIYRIDKTSGQLQRLQQVETSIFWGCQVEDCLFFSTAVEPSEVNKCTEACIWGSPDGENWKCIARFRKDVWPMREFQYGQIMFPSGLNETGRLWFTPFATKGDNTVQSMDISVLF